MYHCNEIFTRCNAHIWAVFWFSRAQRRTVCAKFLYPSSALFVTLTGRFLKSAKVSVHMVCSGLTFVDWTRQDLGLQLMKNFPIKKSPSMFSPLKKLQKNETLTTKLVLCICTTTINCLRTLQTAFMRSMACLVFPWAYQK